MGMARRSGIQKDLAALLGKDWDPLPENAMTDRPRDLQLEMEMTDAPA